MCGIAGFVGDFVPELRARMDVVQVHGGADSSRAFEDAVAAVDLNG